MHSAMPSERLDALLRQRALVSQHLAWLDTEIAAANSDGAPPPLATPSPPVRVPAPAPAFAAHEDPTAFPPSAPPEVIAQANARADEIIAEHSTSDRFDPVSTKRGCILLAIAVSLLGVTGILGAYLFWYR